MDITQTFYDSMASEYDKLFMDWNAATHEQAVILDRIFRDSGFDSAASVLDCACGIGTQSVGLAALGYHMPASLLPASGTMMCCCRQNRPILRLISIRRLPVSGFLSRHGIGKGITIS